MKKELTSESINEFLKDYFKQRNKNISFIRKNGQNILKKTLKYMTINNLSILDSEDIRYSSISTIKENHFYLLSKYLLHLANENRLLITVKKSYFPTSYACFSFNNQQFIIQETIGQGSCQQILIGDFHGLWKKNKVIFSPFF